MADVTVEHGNLLEVEYAVENFGDEIDTQDVRLLTDAPRDIPDSDILYFVEEGSGTTLTDNRGLVNATLSGSTWVSDTSALRNFYLTQGIGGDEITTDSVSFFEGLSEFAISWWARVPSDAVGWWFQRFGGSVPDTTSVTDFVYLNGSREWQFRVSGDTVLNVSNSTDIDSWFDGVWRQFGVSYSDGEFARFYVDGSRVAENVGASGGTTSTGESTFHIVTQRDGSTAGSDVNFDGHWLFSQNKKPDSWFSQAYINHPRS